MDIETIRHLENYCVFDIESSGLDPSTCRILELGLMKVQDGNPIMSKALVVNAGVEVLPIITKVTGLTQEAVDGGLPIKEVLDWFMDLSGNVPLVGHNLFRFDQPFLIKESHRNSHPLKDLLPITRLIDTAVLYKGWKMGWKTFPTVPHHVYASKVMDRRVRGLKFNLKTASETVGVDLSEVELHRAEGDVYLTQKLFESLKSVI